MLWILLVATSSLGRAAFEARYYAGRKFDREVHQRTDEDISFDWGEGAPAPGVPADDFSVCWSATLTAPSSGTFTLNFLADDGVCVWVDEQQVINSWGLGYGERSVPVKLEAGQQVHLQVLYMEVAATASAKLDWVRPDGQREPIPASALTPVAPAPRVFFTRPCDGASLGVIPTILCQAETYDPAGEVVELELFINEMIAWVFGVIPESPGNWHLLNLPPHTYSLRVEAKTSEGASIATGRCAFKVENSPPLAEQLRKSDVCVPWRNPNKFPDINYPSLKKFGATVCLWGPHGPQMPDNQYRQNGIRNLGTTENLILVAPKSSVQGQRFLNDAGLLQALKTDPWGAFETVPWWDECLWRCPMHPLSIAQLKRSIRDAMAMNPDNMQFDGALATLCAMRNPRSGHGCMCDELVFGFRDYLRDVFSDDELAALGIEDVATFDYRVLIHSLAKDMDAFAALVEKGEVPLYGTYQAYQHRRTVDLYQELIDYARGMRGKQIPLTANLNTMFPSMMSPVDGVDAVYSETRMHMSQDEDYINNDYVLSCTVVPFKLSEAFGKQYAALLRNDSNRWLNDTRAYRVVLRWIALTYGMGANLCIPVYSFPEEASRHPAPWAWDEDEAADYYRFIQKNAVLFDDYESVSQIAFLYSAAQAFDLWKPRFHKLEIFCDHLLQTNIPFSFVVAGNPDIPWEMDAERLEKAERILVLGDPLLSPAHQAAMAPYQDKMVSFPLETTPEMVAEKLSSLASVVQADPVDRVWLLPRRHASDPNAPLLVHVVNRQFDMDRNSYIDQTSITVRIATKLTGAPVSQVVLYRPELPETVLPFTLQDGYLNVTLPALHVWGILSLETRK